MFHFIAFVELFGALPVVNDLSIHKSDMRQNQDTQYLCPDISTLQKLIDAIIVIELKLIVKL